ncbi:hypothetical protein BKA61DRAFT_442202, partial [Leptodontidium sp. MPI-SDFR-AT-0119]
TARISDKAVLPFGFGLHCTTFGVNVSLTHHSTNDLRMIVKRCHSSKYLGLCEFGQVVVDVHNAGDVASDYSALAFVSGNYEPKPHPIKELAAYKRLHDIKAGETKHASLPITLGSLARWDEEGRQVLYPDCYEIAIDTHPELAEVTFTLTGEPRVLEVFP